MPLADLDLTRPLRGVLVALARITCPDDLEELAIVEEVVAETQASIRALPPHLRAGLAAGITAFEASAMLLSPSWGRPFSALPPDLAQAHFERWYHSDVGALHQLARGLKALLTASYYDHPLVTARLGFAPGPWIDEVGRARRDRWSDDIASHEALLRQPDPLVTPAGGRRGGVARSPSAAPASDPPRAPRGAAPAGLFTRETWEHRGDVTRLDCDVVVIGSGAGGAVVAAELAEAGLDVIVCEEGGYWPTESFVPETMASARRLYRDGGAAVTIGTPSIQFIEGRCVGGSTTVNGGMSWPTPEKVLHRWAHDHGVEGASRQAMEPYFARVEKYIAARPQDPGTIGRDNELLNRGADRLGWDVIPNIRNQVHCAGANNCAFGCPTGAKQSTLVSYVPRALTFGARLYADCRVERIRWRGKRAIGVAGQVAGQDGAPARPFEIDARLVVAAAGAMETPALLLRSGMRSPSGRIGHNLTLHPNAKMMAVFDDPVDGWKGVHQAYQVREFEDEGLLMAAVNIPPAAVAMALPHYGQELGDLLALYDRVVTGGILCEDTTSGQVRMVGGRPFAFYSVSDHDAARLVRGVGLLAELLLAAGARRVVSPVAGMPDLRSPDDLRHLRAHPVDKGSLDLMTVHLMGTAAMGDDPLRHVCNAYGRVYEADRLYVADASLFPTPIGVNPMETIMALATRNAQRIIETQASWRKGP